MAVNESLLGRGAGMVARNKRYILWFYVLNLLLGGLTGDKQRARSEPDADQDQREQEFRP